MKNILLCAFMFMLSFTVYSQEANYSVSLCGLKGEEANANVEKLMNCSHVLLLEGAPKGAILTEYTFTYVPVGLKKPAQCFTGMKGAVLTKYILDIIKQAKPGDLLMFSGLKVDVNGKVLKLSDSEKINIHISD